MTKYIDRYYLNWEEYGIKFAGGWWQPWANLVAYYSFENDWNDHKWDFWYTWTMYDCTQRNTFTYSYDTWKVWNCLNRTNSWNASLNTWISLSNKYTIMFWYNSSATNTWVFCGTTKTSDGGYGMSFQFNWNWDYTWFTPWVKVYNSHYYADNAVLANTWHHYAVTQDGANLIFYVDWVWKSFTVDWKAWPNTLQLLWIFDTGSIWMMDEVYVFDNRILTSEEINSYLSTIS